MIVQSGEFNKSSLPAIIVHGVQDTVNPIAVPVHFGTVVGTMADAKAFVAGLPQSINGVILSK